MDILWAEMEEIVKHLGLPERTLYAVCDAAMGLRVRNSTYRNLAELNDIMASRDLKNAVDAGLLIPSGERRGRLYIGAPHIRAVFDRLRQEYIRPIPDPFTTRPEQMELPNLL